MDYDERRKAYAADVTYGTNNEFGFDYLRDNMAVHIDQCVQRNLHYAIVDEVDSILIDEARTPLIISGMVEESVEGYYKGNDIAKKLNKSTDFTLDEKTKNAVLTEAGIKKCEKLLNVQSLFDIEHMEIAHQIIQSLKAWHLYGRDTDYVVKDGEVVIVDEFTGRLMIGRRYSDGMHQAIEAKENVTIQEESQTLATITFQNYFRMYKKAGGHDRHGQDRRRRVLEDLQAGGHGDPHSQADDKDRPQRRNLQDEEREIQQRRQRDSGAL